jgi:hypothetical protein
MEQKSPNLMGECIQSSPLTRAPQKTEIQLTGLVSDELSSRYVVREELAVLDLEKGSAFGARKTSPKVADDHARNGIEFRGHP